MKIIPGFIILVFAGQCLWAGNFTKNDKCKAKPTVAQNITDRTSDSESIQDYNIQINGSSNLIKVSSENKTIRVNSSTSTNPKAENSIEINGEGNSVSISQETTGKVAVKQNGNNNRIMITQSIR